MPKFIDSPTTAFGTRSKRKPSNRRGVKGHEWKKHLNRDRTIRGKQNERLNKVRVQVAFAQSIQDFLPPTFTKQQRPSARLSSEPAPVCHFLRLPPEIRTIIYECVLKRSCTIWLSHRKTSWAGEHGLEQRIPLSIGPALFRVSKDIRGEALPVYFRINSFMLRTRLSAINHAASWLGTMSLYCKRRSFGGLQFRIDQAAYAELARVEKLVRLLACGKLKLDVSGIDLSTAVRKRGSSQGSRLFRMQDAYGGMYVQRALEEAAFLGTTAREQGWNRKKVASQFQDLLAQQLPLKYPRAYNRERSVPKR